MPMIVAYISAHTSVFAHWVIMATILGTLCINRFSPRPTTAVDVHKTRFRDIHFYNKKIFLPLLFLVFFFSGQSSLQSRMVRQSCNDLFQSFLSKLNGFVAVVQELTIFEVFVFTLKTTIIYLAFALKVHFVSSGIVVLAALYLLVCHHYFLNRISCFPNLFWK